MRYQTRLIEEACAGGALRLHCIADLDSAIDEMFAVLQARGSAEMLEELCPYFGAIWPSARVLARWVWEQGPDPFRGKTSLELGCGLALPSFAVSRLGAQATASDMHPDVPLFLARNLCANPGLSMRYRRLDWRAKEPRLPPFDWILGSDVLYERYQAASLIRFLGDHLAPGGRAALLDPNRSYWERLVVLARGKGFRVTHQTLAAREPGDPSQAVLILVRR